MVELCKLSLRLFEEFHKVFLETVGVFPHELLANLQVSFFFMQSMDKLNNYFEIFFQEPNLQIFQFFSHDPLTNFAILPCNQMMTFIFISTINGHISQVPTPFAIRKMNESKAHVKNYSKGYRMHKVIKKGCRVHAIFKKIPPGTQSS